jgi:SAM-dependent methyltransferase
MPVVDAESLTRSNLAYREPALYDELLADSSLVPDLMSVVDLHTADARTVLDLGCGTGRVLAELDDQGLVGTGVDLQPSVITWARRARPRLRLEIGDVRATRLATTFDLVICVGNTLSYLHTDAELAAAFDTICAHSHPGTLLMLATLTGSGRHAQGSSEITTSLGAATITATSTWNPATQIQTTVRTWRFAAGRIEQDIMHRRFWSREKLTDHAHSAGFESLSDQPSSLSLCAKRRR